MSKPAPYLSYPVYYRTLDLEHQSIVVPGTKRPGQTGASSRFAGRVSYDACLTFIRRTFSPLPKWCVASDFVDRE